MFLMRPSPKVNACIRYCLALAQRRSGVKIHSVVFLSNHYHILVTDPDGLLPLFTEELNKLIAKSLNSHLGRWENFFSSGDQTSQVTLQSESVVMAKTLYLLTNPTKAMLVSHGEHWPGVRLFRKGEYKALKPKFHFRTEEEGGHLPDQLHLSLTPPPIGVVEQRCDDVVKTAVSAQERELRQLAKTKRRKFMGAKAVKAQNVYSSPKTPAPKRGISPRVACRDKWRRIEVLARLGEFTETYKEKRREFLDGVTDVLFPVGTYQMVRQYGARCEEP